MSARDKLLATFGVDLDHLNQESRSLLENAADGILAEHAHELAEMIRESEGRPPVHATKNSRLTYRWHARRAADLIDPEVTE